MTTPIRILVPGAGGPGTINLCRSLRRAPEPVHLIGTDCDRAFATLAQTDEIHLVPPARDENAYLERIQELVHSRNVDVILPNNSIEVRALAKNRDDISAAMLVPPVAFLDLANSKWESYQRWRDQNLPVPQTWLLEQPDDVHQAFEELKTRPVWVRGAGIPGRGIGVASLPCKNSEEARVWVDYWSGWGGVIASEFLPGANLTWIGLFQNGELITGQGRERDRYVIPHVSPSGITGAPAISHTVHREDIAELGLKAARCLDPNVHGVVFVDFKCDEKDQPYITELNACRFGTTHFFYTAAGLNLPWLSVLLALNRPLPETPKTNPLPDNLYWIRTLDAGPVMISGTDLDAGNLDAGIRFNVNGTPLP